MSSKVSQQQYHQLQSMEQIIGRIAMIGAMGIVVQEITNGQSIVEQIINLSS